MIKIARDYYMGFEIFAVVKIQEYQAWKPGMIAT